MTDRELLELAAKAAGIEVKRSRLDDPGAKDLLIFANRPNIENSIYVGWNPLTDDGDALRLAVKLNIVIWECAQYERAMAEVRYGSARGEYWEPVGDDPYAATRRAIVRAAAELGKETK